MADFSCGEANQVAAFVLTRLLLNCLFLFFIHLKLELLAPASNDEKYLYLWKK